MSNVKTQAIAAQETALEKLRRDSESKLNRDVTLETKMGEDGTLRAELKVAEGGNAKCAHIFSIWEEESLHAVARRGKAPTEEVHTEEEMRHAEDVIAKVRKKLEGTPVESRFVATGGRYFGCVPPTEEQKSDAGETAAYLRQISIPAGERGLTCRTFARLSYSEKDSSWEVRICPAAILGRNPSEPDRLENSNELVAKKVEWYDLAMDALRRHGTRSIRVAFGRVAPESACVPG